MLSGHLQLPAISVSKLDLQSPHECKATSMNAEVQPWAIAAFADIQNKTTIPYILSWE